MQSMTVGKPARLLIHFTLPLIVGQLVQILYGYMDMLVVGRTLGMNALAGVGSTLSVIHLIIGFCMGFAGAIGIRIAQRYGAKDEEGMRHFFGLGICVCLCVSGAAAFIMVPMAEPVLLALGTPPEIIGDARRYMQVILGAAPVSMLGALFPGVLRAVGNSRSAVSYQMISTVLNTATDLLFILVFGWGVTGAALSTVLAHAFPPLMCAILIYRKYPGLRLSRIHFRPDTHRAGEILSLGVPMGLQQSIVEIGNLFVQSAINGLGAVSVAAVVAAQRVRAFNMMPLFSLGTSVSAYTAQNFGAGRFDRVRAGIRAACIIATASSAVMAVFNLLAGGFVAKLLLPDASEAAALSYQYLALVGCCLFLLGVMLVFRNALQGMGRNWAPTLSSMAELSASVLCAFFLVPAYGFWGVSLANPLAWLLSGIPLFIAYACWAKGNSDGKLAERSQDMAMGGKAQ